MALFGTSNRIPGTYLTAIGSIHIPATQGLNAICGATAREGRGANGAASICQAAREEAPAAATGVAFVAAWGGLGSWQAPEAGRAW
jgi:hypothetical protein